MRIYALALAGLALLGATVAPAAAQNSAAVDVTVNGTVIAPLTIASSTAVTMPTVVKPISGSSSVQIDCTSATSTTNGVASWSGNANPFVNGNSAGGTSFINTSSTNSTLAPGAKTGTCASIVVNGESGYYFLTTTGGGTSESMGVLAFIGNCTTASTVLTAGTATVYCGAVISVGPTVGATYTGTMTVTVTYD